MKLRLIYTHYKRKKSDLVFLCKTAKEKLFCFFHIVRLSFTSTKFSLSNKSNTGYTLFKFDKSKLMFISKRL